jgi:hypothetical protein
LETVYKSNEINFISQVSTMLQRSLQQLYNMFLTTMSWGLNDMELYLVVSSVLAFKAATELTIMSNTRGCKTRMQCGRQGALCKDVLRTSQGFMGCTIGHNTNILT